MGELVARVGGCIEEVIILLREFLHEFSAFHYQFIYPPSLEGAGLCVA